MDSHNQNRQQTFSASNNGEPPAPPQPPLAEETHQIEHQISIDGNTARVDLTVHDSRPLPRRPSDYLRLTIISLALLYGWLTFGVVHLQAQTEADKVLSLREEAARNGERISQLERRVDRADQLNIDTRLVKIETGIQILILLVSVLGLDRIGQIVAGRRGRKEKEDDSNG